MTLGQTTTPVHRIKDALLQTVGSGVNVETLTANRTITLGDAPHHVFTCTGTIPRTVTLPGVNTSLIGLGYRLVNGAASTTYLNVVDEDGTVLGFVFPGGSSEFRQQGTAYSAIDTSVGAKGVRLNAYTSTTNEVTAIQSANVAGGWVTFEGAVPMPANFLRGGSVLSASALLQVTNAANALTLTTELVLGGPDTWALVIDTATDAEAYGVNLTRPAAGSIAYTSGVGTDVAAIADGVAAAWNASTTCALYATAVSDGIDTVTFTAVNGVPVTIVEDENAAKMTISHSWSPLSLVATTAVDPVTTSDYQILSTELNSLEAPDATASVTAIGSWATCIDVGTTDTKDSSAAVVLPTDIATDAILTLACRAKWSATGASTKVKLAQFNVWAAR